MWWQTNILISVDPRTLKEKKSIFSLNAGLDKESKGAFPTLSQEKERRKEKEKVEVGEKREEALQDLTE